MSEAIGVFEHATGGIVLSQVVSYYWVQGTQHSHKSTAWGLFVFLAGTKEPVELDHDANGDDEKSESVRFIRTLHFYLETRT